MIQRILIGIFWSLILSLGLSAQTTVRAELSNTSILIGDQVNLQIRVSQPGDAQVDIYLDSLEAVKGIEILHVADPIVKKDAGLTYVEQNITLTSFDTGQYLLPEIPVSLLHTSGQQEVMPTNALPLIVQSLPSVSEDAQLNPIKDIEREDFTFLDALPYLAGALGLFLIGFLIWWLAIRKPPEEVPDTPRYLLQVHDIALKKLNLLEEQKLWQQGRIKDYYSRLTYIAREYLEYRYRIPALESTTGEILREMQQQEETDEALLQQLRHILSASDMVKFAKAEPAAAFHQEALKITRTFIETTKQEEAEPIPVALETMEIVQAYAPGSSAAAGPVVATAAAVLSTGDEAIISGVKPIVEAAGFWPRFFARLIDVVLSSMLVLLSVSFSSYIARDLMGDVSSPGGIALTISLAALWLWTYYALIPYRLGGTVGKKLLQIRTVDLEEEPLSLGRASLRFVSKMFTEALLGLGYLTYFFTKERKSLPDLLAGTKVIKSNVYRLQRPAEAGFYRPLALAGFWPRFFARLLDLVFLGLSIGLFLLAEILLLATLDVGDGPDWMAALFVVLYVFMIWAYFSVTTARFGATPGKLLLKIQVVDMQDQQVNLKRATLRFLGIIMAEMFSGLGYLTYFVNKNKRQSLPDIFANTRVVKKRAKTRDVLLDRLDD